MAIEAGRAALTRWLRAQGEERDGAGLAFFRILLGLVMTASALRFLAKGWVQELYVGPAFHFQYFGFSWVRPWPEPWMTLHLGALGLLAFLLALGLCTRLVAALYLLLFTYAELLDVATYLNHYYLVSLLALLLVFVPAGATWSLDAQLFRRRAKVKLGHYTLLRAQLAVVYVFAGLAKLNSDWLCDANPVRIWLRAEADLPLLGPLLSQPFVAYGMSYFGAVFDLFIVVFLSVRRTRRWAWLLAVAFHVAIGLLFPIGVFSFVMLACITIFNEPDAPRRWLLRWWSSASSAAIAPTASRPPRRAALVLAGLYLLIQVAVPLRYLAYPGWVNWTEQGFRFAWRVMLIEKTGHVEFRVRPRPGAREIRVDPRQELTPLQLRMLSTQPDLVHQYAKHLAETWRFTGMSDSAPAQPWPVEVRADAWVAFNGRRSQRFIDPTVDLAHQPRSLGASDWILPLEQP